LVIFCGGSKIEEDGGATEWGVREGRVSRMGSRIALKMMGSLSRATICRSMERHAVIEPPKANRGTKLVWKLMNAKSGKIQRKDEADREGVPTPHCQSKITSFLSVRVAKMIEKKT
jgi:hypothetical protein